MIRAKALGSPDDSPDFMWLGHTAPWAIIALRCGDSKVPVVEARDDICVRFASALQHAFVYLRNASAGARTSSVIFNGYAATVSS